jgi:hypothetical protein
MTVKTLTDLTLALHHRTEKAVLVSETGEESKAVWLPLSQVEIEETSKVVVGHDKRGQMVVGMPVVEVKLPEWLAIKNGLV